MPCHVNNLFLVSQPYSHSNYKEIPAIYWMTLVLDSAVGRGEPTENFRSAVGRGEPTENFSSWGGGLHHYMIESASGV